MRLRILGCGGSRFPGQHSPAFLLDDRLLMDAGTVCGSLEWQEQAHIEAVLITHSHLDHVKGLANLADNLLVSGKGKSITVYGLESVLEALRRHLFNGIIWPDFGTLPDAEASVIRWCPLESSLPKKICGYEVTAMRVNHSVPAVGYRISCNGSSLLYTGDTGPTEMIWGIARGLSALIVEVSFPNAKEDLAIRSGHLTPALLARELQKLEEMPRRIMVMHLKAGFREEIARELADLGIEQLEIIDDGAIHHF